MLLELFLMGKRLGKQKMDYVILTDSGLDVPAAIRHELGIEVYRIPIFVDEKEFDYNVEIDDGFEEFYKKLKAGSLTKTAALNPFDYREILEPFLKEGKDVIYVGFSSNISGSLGYFKTAVNDLLSDYPERKIILCDTLSLSFGGGKLVQQAAKMLADGKSGEEIQKYVEEERFKTALMFTPETLTYLKRGGRLSGAKAAIGNFLNLKPILYVNNDGVLDKACQVQGRKKSLQTMCEIAARCGDDIENQEVVVLHSLCEEDAKLFAEMVKKSLNPKEVKIYSIGPVIGAHCGPGTIGFCFRAKTRDLK